MKLLNERNQIQDVAERWRATHGDGTYKCDKRNRPVSVELAALDKETATAEQVAEIIGNGSWVRERTCDECGQSSWGIVQLGEEPDYESCTADICADCLRSALKLLESK